MKSPADFRAMLPRSVVLRMDRTGDDTLLTADEVAQVLSTTVASLRRMIRDGMFPAPFSLGGRTERWFLHAVRDAVIRMQWVARFGLPPKPTPEQKGLVPESLLEVSHQWQEFATYKEPVVYFLLLGGKVVYIGSSTCLPVRIVRHKQKSFDRVVYFRVEEARMLAIETEMIRRFKPPLNFVGNPARERRRRTGCSEASTDQTETG